MNFKYIFLTISLFSFITVFAQSDDAINYHHKSLLKALKKADIENIDSIIEDQYDQLSGESQNESPPDLGVSSSILE